MKEKDSREEYGASSNAWKTIRLGDISSTQYGYTEKAIFDDSLPKFLRITDIHSAGVDWHAVPNCAISKEDYSKYELHDEDIVIARTGATTGKSYFITNPPPSVFASYLIRLTVDKGYSSKYIYYFLQSNEYWSQIIDLAAGIAQPGVNAKKLANIVLKMPSLDEQRRIVACIERLFAHLNAAEQKVRQVREASTRRQQSLLHQAIHGELTKKWREAHGITKERWRTVKLSEVCDRITDGTHHSPPNTAHGDVMYVTAKNIKEDGIDLTDITYVSHEVHDEIYKRCDVKKGDVLYIKDGATAGIATINDLDEPFSLLSSVALLRPDKKKLLAGYLKYTLNDPYLKRKILTSVAGNAITRLTLKKIKEIPISICDIAEQHEIVRCLDGLMTHERRIASACGTALRQIEALRTTILARAFRGEL